MRLYTVYDKVALESGPLVECKNDDVAHRMFTQAVPPEQRHEMQLLCLGVYNHDPVSVELFQVPLDITTAKSQEVTDAQN